MKSLSVSVFWPAWRWCRKPETKWLYSSYAQDLAIRDSLATRRLITSPWYQRRWGHVYQLQDDENQKTLFTNTALGRRLATGVGGRSTGEGGDVIVVDDPHLVTETSSDVMRQATIDWWNLSMSTRGNNPDTAAWVIVMQRIHEQDLAGEVLKGGDYVHLMLPAEYEPRITIDLGEAYNPAPNPLGWKDPRTEEGQLLWPERFSRAAIEKMKVPLGPMGVAGQLQQRPAPAEGAMFKRVDWMYYDKPPRLTELPIMSWDMAFKDTKDSSYVVGQVWARVGANYYLLDQVRGKWDFNMTVQMFRALCAEHPYAIAKLVEDKANGPAVITFLRNEIPGIIAINPQGGKEARANAILPLQAAHNIWLPDPSLLTPLPGEAQTWVVQFVEEASKFPASAFSDQVDTMSQALGYYLLRGSVLGPEDAENQPMKLDMGVRGALVGSRR
jgi:predicted phage terminase large subunit-like protein